MQGAYLLRQHRGVDIGIAFLPQYLFHQFDIIGRIVYDQNLGVQDVLAAGHAYSRQIEARGRIIMVRTHLYCNIP
jgi:hypothetical protein